MLAVSYQILLLVLGFILTRAQLRCYGSDVYGLSVSAAYFLSFINLCDMGITAVISAALYRPLAEHDMHAASGIMAYSKRFFRIVGMVLAVYVACLAVWYPRLVAGEFDPAFTVTLILAISISHFGQFFVGMPYQILLDADQKTYVQFAANGVSLILSTAVSLAVMAAGGSIQAVKLAASLIFLIRPLVMAVYVRRHYKLDPAAKPSGELISQKWSGVLQHISNVVYTNTDVIVLTVCSAISNVSIYSVYALIAGSIRVLILSAAAGVQALFGNLIAGKEQEALCRAYDLYEWAMHTVTVLLYTLMGILAVPFVMIYTRGVYDADYRNPGFAVLITAAYAVMMLREAWYILVRAAGKFRDTRTAAVAEAAINLGLSVFLVRRFGLIGVAAGTLAASLFFTVYLVWFFSGNVLKRSPGVFLRQVGLDLAQVVCMLLGTSWIRVPETGYPGWLLSAVCAGAVCFLVSAAFQMVFCREHLTGIRDVLWNRTGSPRSQERKREGSMAGLHAFLDLCKLVRPAEVLEAWKLPVAAAAACLYRRVHPDLWIVSEDPNEARDNGYWFFKYVRETDPAQECVYAIRQDSPDYPKAAALGETVEYGSLRHWILYLASSVQVSSQKSGDPNAAVFYFLQVYGLLKNRRVFLQHGITVSDAKWLYYPVSKISRFLCGARPEYEFVKDRFGYPEGNVCYTGLCRFDGLHDFQADPSLILIMPTWRNWFVIRRDRLRKYEGTDRIQETTYFMKWREFLTDEALREIAEDYHVRFIFFPHRNMQRFLPEFPKEQEYLEVARAGRYDVQELLKRASLLITDYSSVFLDMVYMKKPVIFYQFDSEAFREGQYAEGYFDYDDNPFGKSCRDKAEVFALLRQAIADGYAVSDAFRAAHAAYFPLYDTDNTARAYAAAKELSASKGKESGDDGRRG